MQWAWSSSHQGILANEHADVLVEQGRRAHLLLLYPSPSPPALAEHYRPWPCTYDPNEDCPIAMALFNTLDQESSDSSSDDATISPAPSLLALCAVLRTPLPKATPSRRAVWQALGLEPMREGYQNSGDKEALSPASQPLYLCLQSVPDPEPVEPVKRVLYSDREDHNTDVSDKSVKA